MKEKYGILLTLLALVVLPIGAGWVGDIIRAHLNGEELGSADIGLIISGLIAISIIVFLVTNYSKRLLPPRTISRNPQPEPRKVLIALLSENRGLTENEAGELMQMDVQGNELKLPIELEAVIDKNGVFSFNWQQTLRAAHYHREVLERIYLIASRDGSGQLDELQLAEKIFAFYFPGKTIIYGYQDDTSDDRCFPDFNELDPVRYALGNVLRLANKAGYSDKQIMIDCTGGMKTTSIAAAIVTLDRPDLQFQYMGTGKQTGYPLAYNLVTQKRYD